MSFFNFWLRSNCQKHRSLTSWRSVVWPMPPFGRRLILQCQMKASSCLLIESAAAAPQCAHSRSHLWKTVDSHQRGASVFLLFTSCQGLKLTSVPPPTTSIQLRLYVARVKGQRQAFCCVTGREVGIASLRQITEDTQSTDWCCVCLSVRDGDVFCPQVSIRQRALTNLLWSWF